MKHCARILIVVAILLTGCSAVYAPEPLGDRAVQLDSSWAGSWLSDDATVTTNVHDDQTKHGYHWFLVEKKSDRLVLVWGPDAEQFVTAISEEKLPGTVLKPDDPNSDDVVLGELEPEHLDRIIDPASGLVDWKDPLVLVRVAD